MTLVPLLLLLLLPAGSPARAQETVVVPAPPDERAGEARGAWERARETAWAPRRFKAVFRGEVSQKVGAIVRGYLSLFWDCLLYTSDAADE